jgi:type II secretory pathway component GspD/PulD (secretin)
MRYMTMAVLWIYVAAAGASAEAQERGNGSNDTSDSVKLLQRSEGVPLEKVIAAVAKKSGKKFIVDNRVSGNVQLLGQDLSAVSYSDLLSILLLNGYTAIEDNSYVSVISVSSVRDQPLPLATDKDRFPDAQFVTMVVPVKNVSAPQLVPMLRPLLPTYGHLAAMPCVNSLLIVDNFANVKRVEKIVAALDVGKPYAMPSCEGDHSAGNASK